MVFKKTLVAVATAVTSTAQVTSLNVSAMHSADRRRRRRRRRLAGTDDDGGSITSSGSGIVVHFALSLDVRAVSAATGSAYAVSGPASDDAWVTSNTSVAAALALVADLAADLSAAVRASSDDDDAAADSAWNVAAALAVASLPPGLVGSLSLAASPSAVVTWDPSKVWIALCSWDKPCNWPSPAPTQPRPSGLPTPSPTTVPDFRPGVSAASASLLLLAFVNVAACASLATKSAQKSRAKKRQRSDKALNKELGKFSQAHVMDLFGTSLLARQPPYKGAGGGPSGKRAAASLPQHGSFTAASAAVMFAALDCDGDGKLTAQDLETWLKAQRARTRQRSGVFGAGVFECDEVDAFLRQGCAPPPGALLASASDTTGNAVAFSAPSPFLRGIGGPFDSGSKGPLAFPGALPPQQPIEGPWLSEEGLLQCLSRFPSLAFNWADPLGVGSSHGRDSTIAAPSALGASRSFSREAAAALFRRLDTDGDGVVRSHDLRVWRRMLPLGRPADQLVAKLMASATHVERHSDLSGTTRAGQGHHQSSHHSGRPSGGGVDDDLSLGLKQWGLYMALKDDPELTAELTTQV
jgi:hypothetical protein